LLVFQLVLIVINVWVTQDLNKENKVYLRVNNLGFHSGDACNDLLNYEATYGEEHVL
jgi:hypothetical protein